MVRRRLGLLAFKGFQAVVLAALVVAQAVAAVEEAAGAVRAAVEAGSASSKDLLLTLERIW